MDLGHHSRRQGHREPQLAVTRGSPAAADLLRDGIIGSVEIVAAVKQSESPWFFGPLGLVRRDPRPYEFVPA